MGALIVIVGVILMVVIHEGAHFVAAKSFGMKATEAFFGFGPRIWSMRRGETEYGIKAIPLGGYVKIIGMNPFEEVEAGDEDRTYRANPFWKKSVVVLAGIFSHFVVGAILLYVVILGFGIPELSTSIGRVCPAIVQALEVPNAVAFEFNEDRCSITAVDGVPVQDWEGSDKVPGDTTAVTVNIDGELRTTVTTDRLDPTPALLSGAQVGDRIVEFDGVVVETWRDFQDAAVAAPDKRVDVVVERNGSLVGLQATLAVRMNASGAAEGFYGVSPTVETRNFNVFTAVPRAGGQLWEGVQLSVEGLVRLVANFGDLLGAAATGDEVPVDARPISVIGLTNVAAAGPIELSLELLAFVNIFVGILNFVPMYPLDGGHFAVALYEKARGRPADVRKLMPVAIAVFIFVVVLGILGFYFDLVDPVQLVARVVP